MITFYKKEGKGSCKISLKIDSAKDPQHGGEPCCVPFFSIKV